MLLPCVRPAFNVQQAASGQHYHRDFGNCKWSKRAGQLSPFSQLYYDSNQTLQRSAIPIARNKRGAFRKVASTRENLYTLDEKRNRELNKYLFSRFKRLPAARFELDLCPVFGNE